MKAVFNLLSATSLKVLLVEDNAQEAELIEDLLSEISIAQQVSVTKADRLCQAQQLLERENFDIILLDLSLPDSIGIETVARVQEYGLNLPIVVLTAQKDEELALRSISAGVQDYLVKRNIDSELLIRSLRYAIERQHSQDALRKSEEKYRSIVENSLVGIGIISPVTNPPTPENCNWIETNDALCNLLGYKRSELAKKNWLDLTHPDDRRDNLEQLSQILTGAIDGCTSDKRWLRQDGKIVYTRVSLRCIRGRDGSIDRIIKIVLDVSDRYRYETQLKGSEQFLNHVINATPDPIFVKDDRHRWILLNDAFCELVGKPRSKLIGKSHLDFFTQPEIDLCFQTDKQVLQTGIATETEGSFTDSQDNKHIISTKKSVFQKPDGSKIIVGTIRDITEYRRQQIALEQSEARFQKLVANLPGVIYQFRMSANAPRSIPYISSGSRELYELEPETIRQNPELVFGGVHPDDVAALEESIAISSATMQPWQHQWRHIMPSGKVKWVQGVSRLEPVNCEAKSGSEVAVVWDGLMIDITELKQAQSERDRFFTISLDLLCIIGFDGYFKRLNPAWLNSLGYTNAELFAQPVIEFIHPEDREASTAELEKLIVGISTFYFENRWICQDGSYKWVLWTASPFSEEGLIYAVGRDITSRKEAESALKRQAAAMAAAYDGIAIFNHGQNYIYVNDAYLKMYGFKTAGELLGKSWKTLYRDAEIQQFDREIGSAIEQTGYCHTEVTGYRPNGTQFHQELSLTAIAGGEIIAIVRDISNRKQAEIALRESQRRYRTLAESSPVCIFHSDAFSNCFYVNQRWTEITGLNPDIAAKHGWLNAIHPEDAERVKQEWNRAVVERVPFKSEYRFLRPDGAVIWAICQAVAEIGDGGEIKGYVGTITDISDRKKAEEELREVTVSLENALEGISRLDAQGNYISVNKAYASAAGYEPSETIGMKWSMTVHPDDLEKLQAAYELMLQTGKVELEARGVRKDGSIFHKQVVMTAIRDAQNNFSGHYCFMKDISDRKQAELELRRVTQAVESTSDAIGIADLQGRSIYHNQAFIQRYGYTAAELNSAGGIAAMYPQTTELLEIFKTIRKGKSWQGEIKIKTKSNEQVTTLFRADSIKDENGNLIGLVGVITDITERKLAEIALVHQLRRERLVVAMLDRIRSSLNLEEVLTAAVEQVRKFLETDRTVIYRFNSDWTGRVVVESVAENCRSLYGLNFNDTCFDDKFMALYQQGFIRALEDIYSADLTADHINLLVEYEVKACLVVPILQAKDSIASARSTPGNHLWGLLIAHDCKARRDWDSSEIESLRQLCVQLAIAIQQSTLFQQAQTEIAERKQAEAALQQAKESAETANRAKSEFLANMSHELRTPLNGVLGYAQILKTDKHLNAEHQQSLSSIEQCGKHLLMLIDDVLDLSKIEASKMELYPAELNFTSFTQSLAHLFQMRATQKGITFSYEQVSPLPSSVQADEKRLRQILINLLSNAVKFTDSGGVTFKVGYVGSGAWSRGQGENSELAVLSSELKQNYMLFAGGSIADKHSLKIRFQVEDTGTGIEPSKLEEIFLPFHQASTNRFVEGTGLGLSIGQKLAKMMGSEIRVKSRSGVGSTFWLDLELPAAKRYLEVPSLEDKRWLVGFVGDKRKVLIADDDRVNRSMLCSLLSRLGFEVTQATNGRECIRQALEFKPDAILIDLLMPVMDGLETARRLRQLPELKDVVLIALSASVFESKQQESLLAGYDRFVPKPIEANHFLEHLRSHLGLEWIYEECVETKKRKHQNLTATPDVPEYASLLPSAAESVANLLKLAAMGDIEGVAEETAKIENLDPKLMPLVARIRQLTKGFQLKQIRNLLKEYIAGNREQGTGNRE
ncbi:MAG: PAS domain S-box protein [Oscillatoriaceae cyanobacterium Prado104]|jgi:PAS domain S-box-containing protein|nr:PAS domain S-box protein [Oscillatoriaceae cyanobacterium Prado104]